MPLTREQTKYVPSNDTVFLPTVAIGSNLGVRGNSVFDGTATFNNGLTATGLITATGNLVQNVNATAKTAAYQLTAADANTIVQMNGTFAFNVDTSLAVLPLGTTITLVAQTTGVTVAANGGAVVPTINATPGLKLRAAWSVASLIKMTDSLPAGSASTWLLAGDLSA